MTEAPSTTLDRRALLALGGTSAAGLLVTGCGGGDEEGRGQAAAQQDGGGSRVELDIVRGALGTVQVIASVTIDDRGPFPFLLDTGSEKTTVDVGLAQRLGLERLGRGAEVGGIAGSSRSGQVVRLERWRLGDVELPRVRAVAFNLPQSEGEGAVLGLLGSDVLADFGAIRIDYRNATLELGDSPG